MIYSDRVTDRRIGNVWQLQLYPSGTHFARGGAISVFLHLVEGPNVNARTTYVLRDAFGDAFHRELSDDVDGYSTLKDAAGYHTFFKRTKILNEGNRVLLRGTLIIDVEVQITGISEQLLEEYEL